jgi:hypothetical protein
MDVRKNPHSQGGTANVLGGANTTEHLESVSMRLSHDIESEQELLKTYAETNKPKTTPKPKNNLHTMAVVLFN